MTGGNTQAREALATLKPMTTERWQQIETLFQAALERPLSERAAWLPQACADDQALRAEVEKLLASYEAAGDFLNEPLAESLGLAKDTPRLAKGERLAHYEIVAPLGKGGMGEVYLATDTNLQRPIALKLLSPHLLNDAQFVRRFEAEARAASALNHPNIITVHDIGEEAGVHFIATEFIEGTTLRAQLTEGALPINTALNIAAQIAEALIAAHAAGIIHRDIKPENVMTRPDGLVKVLDFGLAKPLGMRSEEPTPHSNSTHRVDRTQHLKTDPHILLGTLAYLSPEQARHDQLDARTDLFSLGVVLYEMLAGARPFSGAHEAETLDAIQHQAPAPLTVLRSDWPAGLEQIVARALAKAPAARYQTAAELRNELTTLARQLELRKARPRWFKQAAAAVAVALLCAVASLGWLLWRRPPPKNAPTSMGETASPWINAEAMRLTGYSGLELFPIFAPDGERLVYVRYVNQQFDLIVRRIRSAPGSEVQETNLTADSPADDLMPAYAPDSARIAFRSSREGGGLFVMNADGTNVRKIRSEGYFPAWSPDGRQIVYATEGPTSPYNRISDQSRLRILDLDTGATRQLPTGDATQPHWSPHGDRIAYWGLRDTQRDLWTVSANGSGEPLTVTNDAATDWNPIWSPDGRYVYYTSADRGPMRFWRIPIEEKSGKVLGAREAVTGGASESWHPSLSHDGQLLAYADYNTKESLQRSGFDPRAGRVTGKATAITTGERRVTSPYLSPDGAWLAFYSFGNPQEDLFIVRPDGSGQRQLTDDRYSDRARGWSPDSREVLFTSTRSGSYEIWVMGLNEQNGRQLTWCGGTGAEGGCQYAAWSPDGKWLAIQRLGAQSFLLEANKPWQAQTPIELPPLPEADNHFLAWAWSPDGRELAGWQRNTNGVEGGLWVYTLATQRYERLTTAGLEPQWLNDQRRLLFREQRRLWLFDRTTRQAREIMRLDPLGITKAVLSPDNRQLYFSQINSEADLWLLKLNEK